MNVLHLIWKDKSYGETSECLPCLEDEILVTYLCYSAVCGGAGAGPTWSGQSGVHIK
jgi:hypothetical protein